MKKLLLVFFCVVVFLYGIDPFAILNSIMGKGKLPVMTGVGGDFKAPSSEGYDVSLSDYRGNVVLVTFGFTNCPDVCPITLGYLNFVYNKLTPEQQKNIQVLFVTVDPNHDTPEHMKKYVTAFNTNFIGISASEEKLKKIAGKYRVSYEEVKGEENSAVQTYNHSVRIFLIDKEGKVRVTHTSDSDSGKFKDDIVSLLEEN